MSSCAQDIDVNNSNGVWGFGNNTWKQLGFGGENFPISFYPFSLFNNQEIVEIACGAEFTLFLTTS